MSAGMALRTFPTALVPVQVRVVRCKKLRSRGWWPTRLRRWLRRKCCKCRKDNLKYYVEAVANAMDDFGQVCQPHLIANAPPLTTTRTQYETSRQSEGPEMSLLRFSSSSVPQIPEVACAHRLRAPGLME